MKSSRASTKRGSGVRLLQIAYHNRSLSLYAKLGIAFEGSLIMVGAGAIMGIRVGLSLIFATILGWGVLAPVMIHRGDIDHPAPRVTAADGFTQNARLFSDRELYFPVTVPSGAALSLQVRFNDGPPLTLVRRWEKTATYASAASLARGLNRAALPDGRANPFAGKIAFGVDSQKNHIYATFAQSPGTGAVLSVPAGTAAEALGFKPGSSAEVLRFPMAIPAGTHLAFSVGMVDGPRGKMAEKRYALDFQQNVTVRGRESLLALLNGAATPWGAPNPLHGVVSFTWVRGHLAAEAARARQWDSQLTVDDSAGNRLLGFAPGQTRRENYGGYRNIVHWLMWPGVAMMVTAGLLSFFYQWKTVVRALSGLARVFRPKKDREAEEDPVSGIEVPGTWFAVGFLLTGALAVILQISFFGIHWWMAVLAVLMTFLLAIVACRATGETDITPVGPLGKITQLMYGAIAPGNMTTNIMTANVTGGAAASSGDLLQALKCGYLVGASPRKQYISMLLGVGVGALVSVPVYHLLVPTPAVLGTDQLPAPAAQVWAGVALLLSHGFAALPVSARWALLIGGLLGIVITVCEKHVPGARKFLPSPTGMGIALVIPAFNCVSMFLGALAAWLFEKRSKAAADRYTIPVASGIIAGESLMGILVAVLKAFHFMI
ncbi:MAG: OPT/YSL family transporter [Acidobacteriota bacterium]